MDQGHQPIESFHTTHSENDRNELQRSNDERTSLPHFHEVYHSLPSNQTAHHLSHTPILEIFKEIQCHKLSKTEVHTLKSRHIRARRWLCTASMSTNTILPRMVFKYLTTSVSCRCAIHLLKTAMTQKTQLLF